SSVSSIILNDAAFIPGSLIIGCPEAVTFSTARRTNQKESSHTVLPGGSCHWFQAKLSPGIDREMKG
ncbi:hypothetical protein, partial [Lonsdalea iberica]|uniref:hypothetical protein n=1 Tax=Lonsdalea iberica TaxID=1082703 RepID=UPI001C38471B